MRLYRWLVNWLFRTWQMIRHPLARGKGISLLVPFRADGARRQETWEWLKEYWDHELPAAEVILGDSGHVPFSKTASVNQAAKKAHGDVFVILDADCFIPGSVLTNCAKQIRNERRHGHPLWFMPYRHFYRLTDKVSRDIMETNPQNPLRLFTANTDQVVHGGAYEDYDISSVESTIPDVKGNWYGALIQIMPQQAFFTAGMMDERFAGWGGEDVSFLHCVDTLYGKHKTTPNSVTHLWHPNHGDTVHNRVWAGQETAGINSPLAWRYGTARGDKAKMQKLVDEHRMN